MDTENIVLTSSVPVDEELEKILEAVSQRVVFPSRHMFLFPGEKMEFMYYVRQGQTKHYMDNADGTTKLLYTLSRGCFFGETPCFLGKVTTLYSRTEEPTTLYRIPKAEALRLMDECPRFRWSLMMGSSRKNLMMRHEIANLTFNSCKHRLIRLFCSTVDTSRVIDGKWYGLKVNYKQNELGEIVGGARVTISRQLSELCDDGFIRLLNRKVQVNIEQYNRALAQARTDDFYYD